MVQIGYLKNIEWLNGASCTYQLSGSEHIWRIRISSFTPLIHDLWGLLSVDEHERAGRYHREKDKFRFVVSRALLRMSLSKYLNTGGRQIIFELGNDQKPRVKGNNTIHYNVSHSGDIVLIAISNTEVGVDIEQHDTYLHYHDIMQISYSPVEIDLVERSGSPIECFYQLWTRKEALLKAIGKGIDDDLKLIPSVDGAHSIDQNIAHLQNDLLIRSFDTDNGYSASIASYTSNIVFLDITAQVF